MSRFVALVPAAGSGTRMGGTLPKQYLSLAGRPLLAHALYALTSHPRIDRVFLVLSSEDTYWDTQPFQAEKLTVLRCGGKTRAQSVTNGLRTLASELRPDDWVLVHDAARPCLRHVHLDRLMSQLENDPVGGILAMPVADTLKRADAELKIVETVPREFLWQAQTPQMFRYGLLRDALEKAGDQVTDEASAIEKVGLKPRLVEGDPSNLKVTYPPDLELAALQLNNNEKKENMGAIGVDIRIGQGFDVHAFAENRKLILGGVEIPYERGLFGHSDADVLLHAICDALLGAAGLGDIGRHYPDNDARFKDIDSRELLRDVSRQLQELGWRVSNVDTTLIAQAPRMAPYISQMEANIAHDLGITQGQVNVKATTTEKLGFTGRSEGIAAKAVCLLIRP